MTRSRSSVSPARRPPSPPNVSPKSSYHMTPNMVPIKYEQMSNYYQQLPPSLPVLSHSTHSQQHPYPSIGIEPPMNAPAPLDSGMLNIHRDDRLIANLLSDLESEKKRKRIAPTEENVALSSNTQGGSPNASKQRRNSSAVSKQSSKSSRTAKPTSQSDIYSTPTNNPAVLVPSNSPGNEFNDADGIDAMNNFVTNELNTNVAPLPLSNPNSPSLGKLRCHLISLIY